MTNHKEYQTFILEVEDRTIYNNDVKLQRALKNSIFGQIGILDISRNISRQILIVKTKLSTSELTELALKEETIGQWKIKTRFPLNQAHSIGVIGPIGTDTSDEEIMEDLQQDYPEIFKAQRIFKYKGKEKTPTLSVKLYFNTKELPEALYFAYRRFKVSVFIGRVWQCYGCQGFGHNAHECSFKARCLLCAGNHEFKDCPLKEDQVEKKDLKCPNCKGNHAANYGGCPKMKEAKEVEKVRTLEKISYREAVLQVRTTNNDKKASTPATPRGRTIAPEPSQEKKECSTQTEATEAETQTTTDNVDKGLVKNLINLVCSVIKMKSKKINSSSITKLVNETLGSSFTSEDFIIPDDEDNSETSSESEDEEEEKTMESNDSSLVEESQRKTTEKKNSNNKGQPKKEEKRERSSSEEKTLSPKKVKKPKKTNARTAS